MNIRRLASRALVLLMLPMSVFGAEPFPDKPVVLVVGNTAGSAQDLFARELGKSLDNARNSENDVNRIFEKCLLPPIMFYVR